MSDSPAGSSPAASSPAASWDEALRARRGREYWRGLDELLDTAAFRDALRREFPQGADRLAEGMSRRSFIQLLGASMALAGIGACVKRPDEAILPYVDRPPEVTPGRPLYYATSMVLDGLATGLLVESHVGRPTKIEGNPEHPASLGAAGVLEQASVLGLYDPDRMRGVYYRGAPARWEDFVQRVVRPAVDTAGAGLRIVLEPTSSPLLVEWVGRVRERLPAARVFYHAPLAGTGAALAPVAGAAVVPLYDFRAADVVVALDADFLAAMPFHLRYARDFAERRRISAPSSAMNRLYVAEGAPTPTGALADHRLRVRTRDVQQVMAALLAAVVAEGAGAAAVPGEAALVVGAYAAPLPPEAMAWVRAAARDLTASAGRGAVVVGERQPPHVHALAHLLHAALGSVGRTVAYVPAPVHEAGGASHDLAALVSEMAGGGVETLVVVEGNPVYAAPADLELAPALSRVATTAYVGLHANETAHACHWMAPAAHYLEAWGDARAYDGTLSLVQPLIAPLYGGRTPAEVLAWFAGAPPGAHAQLRESWRARLSAGPAPDDAWEEVLRRGLLPGSASPAVSVPPRWDQLAPALEAARRAAAEGARGGLELVFARDASVYDGRFANNAWLQELPEPLTKLAWGNAAELSPATAARLGVDTGRVLRLRYGGRELTAPALVLPGHADDAITLRMGYGRAGGEQVATGVGVNANRLRARGAPYFDVGLAAEPTAETAALAVTQEHWAMEGRPIVLAATIDAYRRDPDFTREHRGDLPTLYDPFAYLAGDQWAMVIDQSLCTGCGACVVACQAENNVPVVGADDVRRSREMHWLRVDRYFTGDPAAPEVVMQPMLCQHCERAPCEYVCPVEATVHSPDGLNEMVYNRCVGTRFCSNNCPYKVRRFNWFDYNAEVDAVVALARNPDVTVRERGVMEKCTFCVQRIRLAQQAARAEGSDVTTGAVQTACQQACPSRAIVFGSYADADSDLVMRLAERRRYAVLHELGTRPRVHYLARITNPSPALPALGAAARPPAEGAR